MDMALSKPEIRKSVLEKRNRLTLQERESAGRSVALRLADLELYQAAETVMIYMDFRGEVPTDQIFENLVQAAKRIVLPYVDGSFHIIPYYVCTPDDLSESPLGIREPDVKKCQPARVEDIDLIIVPGVAFDPAGNRIGYGRGCYDQFLPAVAASTHKIGLAYDFQIFRHLPSDFGDIRMDHLLTPDKFLNCDK